MSNLFEQESAYLIIDDEMASVEMTATLKDIDDFIKLRYRADEGLTKAIACIGIEVDGNYSVDILEVELGCQNIYIFLRSMSI